MRKIIIVLLLVMTSACASKSDFDYNATLTKLLTDEDNMKFAAALFMEDILKNDINNGFYRPLATMNVDIFCRNKKYCDISCQEKIAKQEALFLHVGILAFQNKTDFNINPFNNWKADTLSCRQWDGKY